MVRSAGLGIKHSKPSGINSAGFAMFYTNLNSADADAKSRWTHHNVDLRQVYFTSLGDTLLGDFSPWYFGRMQSYEYLIWHHIIPFMMRKNTDRRILIYLYLYIKLSTFKKQGCTLADFNLVWDTSKAWFSQTLC